MSQRLLNHVVDAVLHYHRRLLQDQAWQTHAGLLDKRLCVRHQDYVINIRCMIDGMHRVPDMATNESTPVPVDLEITLRRSPKANSLDRKTWMNYMDIKGDIATAQYLQKMLNNLHHAPEDLLRPILGPMTAPVAQVLQTMLTHLSDMCQHHLETSVLFLSYEREVLLPRQNFNEFKDALYALEQQVARLESHANKKFIFNK